MFIRWQLSRFLEEVGITTIRRDARNYENLYILAKLILVPKIAI